MTAQEILAEIKPLGSESYRKTMARHGVASCYGVKISDLKKIQKRVKKDYRLALDLFDTGVYDAQYLAGLIADDEKMTKKDLQRWLDAASGCLPLAGWTVPSVAAGSPAGWEVGLEWIESKKEVVACAGWATLAAIVGVMEDAELDLARVKQLLQRVQKEIHQAPNRVRYQMNGFVISVGCYIQSLTKTAREVAEKIGKVEVDMGDTDCQVPFAPDYIKKVEKMGRVGKKRKSAKC